MKCEVAREFGGALGPWQLAHIPSVSCPQGSPPRHVPQACRKRRVQGSSASGHTSLSKGWQEDRGELQGGVPHGVPVVSVHVPGETLPSALPPSHPPGPCLRGLVSTGRCQGDLADGPRAAGCVAPSMQPPLTDSEQEPFLAF